MNDLISIIVPVYNVEKYLNKCLETITSQTYKNIEIILIDDGSRDSSPKICDEWATYDKRIIVIHKNNEGLGFARNTGIELSKGDYIMFVDSDDYISNDMVERLYTSLKKNNADTIYCGYVRVYEDGRKDNKTPYYFNNVFEKEEVVSKVLLNMIGSLPEEKEDSLLEMSVWHSLYSSKIIKGNNILFVSERQIMSEDIIFHIDYLQKANKVVYISDCLYYYRFNPKSLSKIYDPKRFERQKVLYFEIVKRLSKFLDKKDFLQREHRKFLGGVRGQIQEIVNHSKNKRQLIKNICDDSLVKSVIKTYPFWKNPIRHRIFNYCVKHKLCISMIIFVKLKGGN